MKVSGFTRIIGALLLLVGLAGLSVLYALAPMWQQQVDSLVQEAQTAPPTPQAWASLAAQAQELPPVYPLTHVRGFFTSAQEAITALEDIRGLSFSLSEQFFPQEDIEKLIRASARAYYAVEQMEADLNAIPDMLLGAPQREQKASALERVSALRALMRDVHVLAQTLPQALEQEARWLILLQNQNEPRPSGGFAGSFLMLDFAPEGVRWDFADVYNLDRRVPVEATKPAPEYFHGLSKVLSLRDANFYPEFADTAQMYRDFFTALDEKPPQTVMALNLGLLRYVLLLTGPIELPKWGVRLNEENFDLVLSFLVEAKIAGRYQVKQPVLAFADELLKAISATDGLTGKLAQLNMDEIRTNQYILAHSTITPVQKVFERWGMDGGWKAVADADDFLALDLVSIGANKSEKFIWNRIAHDSRITDRGVSENTFTLRRTHALVGGELDRLLGVEGWPPNIRDQLTGDVRWKLGEGQSRVMMRLYLPRDAVITDYKNPSGNYTKRLAEHRNLTMVEIPLFLLPGESLDVELTYEVPLHRGSADARPYFFRLEGTPALERTTFLKTISTGENASFQAQTLNIGRPQPVADSDFRAVITLE